MNKNWNLKLNCRRIWLVIFNFFQIFFTFSFVLFLWLKDKQYLSRKTPKRTCQDKITRDIPNGRQESTLLVDFFFFLQEVKNQLNEFKEKNAQKLKLRTSRVIKQYDPTQIKWNYLKTNALCLILSYRDTLTRIKSIMMLSAWFHHSSTGGRKRKRFWFWWWDMVYVYAFECKTLL